MEQLAQESVRTAPDEANNGRIEDTFIQIMSGVVYEVQSHCFGDGIMYVKRIIGRTRKIRQGV